MRLLREVLLTVLFLVILAGVGVYAFARSGGLSARREPSTLEYAIAVRLRNVSASAQAGDITNPFAEQPDAWRQATNSYARHCAMCHNVNGKGSTLLGSNFSPPSPDLTLPQTQRLSDPQLFAIIRDGVRFTSMPSWRETHSDDEIWRLVAVVRYLPRLELAEMDLLNPVVALSTNRQPDPVGTTGTNPY